MTDNWIWQFFGDIPHGFWNPCPCWVSSDSQNPCCDCGWLCDDTLFPSFYLDKRKPCWLRNSHLKTVMDCSYSLYLFRHAWSLSLSRYCSSRIRLQTCLWPWASGLLKTIISEPVLSVYGLSTELIMICLFPVSFPASCLFSGAKPLKTA